MFDVLEHQVPKTVLYFILLFFLPPKIIGSMMMMYFNADFKTAIVHHTSVFHRVENFIAME